MENIKFDFCVENPDVKALDIILSVAKNKNDCDDTILFPEICELIFEGEEFRFVAPEELAKAVNYYIFSGHYFVNIQNLENIKYFMERTTMFNLGEAYINMYSFCLNIVQDIEDNMRKNVVEKWRDFWRDALLKDGSILSLDNIKRLCLLDLELAYEKRYCIDEVECGDLLKVLPDNSMGNKFALFLMKKGYVFNLDDALFWFLRRKDKHFGMDEKVALTVVFNGFIGEDKAKVFNGTYLSLRKYLDLMRPEEAIRFMILTIEKLDKDNSKLLDILLKDFHAKINKAPNDFVLSNIAFFVTALCKIGIKVENNWVIYNILKDIVKIEIDNFDLWASLYSLVPLCFDDQADPKLLKLKETLKKHLS